MSGRDIRAGRLSAAELQDNFGDDIIDDGTGHDTADFRGLATQSVDIVIDASDTATATSEDDSAIFEPNWEAFNLSNQSDSFDGSLGSNARTVDGLGGDERGVPHQLGIGFGG